MTRETAGPDGQLAWLKSTYSSGEPNSDCVEVAADGGTVHVRDSKAHDRPRLSFAPGPWADFVTSWRPTAS